MKIKINGKEVTLEKETTVKELLNSQNVEMQDYVTVQVNDEIISREDFETIQIKENDTVEFLYFMGGGRI
jgi:sulfur carrier protein